VITGQATGYGQEVTWFVHHRRKGDSVAEGVVVPVDAPTPAAAVAIVRATLPEGHVVTSVAPY
jgi:hypothetical protein